MRVLYDDQIFATQRYGGISRYVTEIARRVALRAETLVSAGMYLNKYLHEAGDLRKSGFYCDQSRAWRIRDAFNQQWTGYQSARFRPEIVHETYYRVNRVHSAKVKVIITVHDLIHEIMPNEAPNSSFHAHLKSEAIKRADSIICVSETTKYDLINIYPGIDEKSVVVIPHGQSYKKASEKSLQAIKEKTSNRPFILYVGHRGGYKRFVDVVDALALLKKDRPELLIFAFGCGAFTPQEKAYFEAKNLKAGDILYGDGEDDVLNAAYESALVFCYPSLYEGFGIPIIEAKAAGCPVVCADTPIFKEVGGDYVSFYPAGDVPALADKILNVAAKNTEMMPSRSHSWTDSANAHFNLYAAM
jgi:glycosyltransferase involved in cell wall biosynthesis